MAYMIFIIPVKGASPVGTVRLVDVHIMFILRMYVPVLNLNVHCTTQVGTSFLDQTYRHIDARITPTLIQ